MLGCCSVLTNTGKEDKLVVSYSIEKMLINCKLGTQLFNYKGDVIPVHFQLVLKALCTGAKR